MEEQSRLTPHMRHYEDFATGDMRWLPYVMFFNRPGYRSPVLTTDSGGFRVSHGPAGAVSLQDAPPTGEASVLLGASPAFGFGATSDRTTIPSLLSRGAPGRGSGQPVPWLNLAAPAFNSTQEAVLFMLHRHRLPRVRVRDIVLLSGLNNLVVAGLPDADGDYPQFFFSGEFFGQLGAPAMGRRMGQPGWARGRLARASRRRAGQDGGVPDRPGLPDPAQRVATAVRNTARDLDRLAELAAPLGGRVHYVLQPAARWTGKPFTREETLLIEEAGAERAMMWDLFAPVLTPEVHDAYAHGLETACKERGVSFLDSSTALGRSGAAGEWLFVDPVHLTDEGSGAVAAVMREALGV